MRLESRLVDAVASAVRSCSSVVWDVDGGGVAPVLWTGRLASRLPLRLSIIEQSIEVKAPVDGPAKAAPNGSRRTPTATRPTVVAQVAPMSGHLRHTAHKRWGSVNQGPDRPFSGSSATDDWPGPAPHRHVGEQKAAALLLTSHLGQAVNQLLQKSLGFSVHY